MIYFIPQKSSHSQASSFLSHFISPPIMHFSTFVLGASAASLAAAAPFSFPLANGFPNLNSTALQQVYKLAGGTLPNGALPSSLKPSGVQALQLIAANEEFEVAYFTELLANITNNVPGYDSLGADRDYIIETITAVQNVRPSFFNPNKRKKNILTPQ
jgi:hypothetical protein